MQSSTLGLNGLLALCRPVEEIDDLDQRAEDKILPLVQTNGQSADSGCRQRSAAAIRPFADCHRQRATPPARQPVRKSSDSKNRRDGLR
jgi:hypothetical protein